jgi:putative DNA methylase
MARAKTKKQILEERIVKTVGAGKEVSIETVDFSDPNRPKTVLEVDFPILPVNQVATIEGNAAKPVYQMAKWWARRRSSVFRTMLLAGAMKAPEDPTKAAKSVWDVYYGNHQKQGALRHLKVGDVFMGGGTTPVEGSRLGMQMYGNDLNPIAWLAVKNELAQVNMEQVQAFATELEHEVKPQIMPYYKTNCPRGHKGYWLKFNTTDVPIHPFYDEPGMDEPSEKELKAFEKKISTFVGWEHWYRSRGYMYELMDETFDPLSLSEEERLFYRYWGPEIIYTFWAKHAPCQNSSCGHRTALMTTPVIAVKDLTVKTWADCSCKRCGHKFDVEEKDVRMSPNSSFVVATDETPFVPVNSDGHYICPSCGQPESIRNLEDKKPKNKKVSLSLLIHPDWIKGTAPYSSEGELYGGRTDDSVASTILWIEDRAKKLQLIEVRGKLPKYITCPETGVTFSTGEESGVNKGRGRFVCGECGTQQQLSLSLAYSGKDAPTAPYAYHCYCPECDQNGEIYNGRSFMAAGDVSAYKKALVEWDREKDVSLKDYWPESEIVFSHVTHQRDNLPNHGYTHWWKMFNKRQLIVLSRLLKGITENPNFSYEEKETLLGAFQLYLRNQNSFTIWNTQRDTPEPHFSNNNYYPKMNFVENSVFSKLGRGNWRSSIQAILKGEQWKSAPFEILAKDYIDHLDRELASSISSKGVKVKIGDPIQESVTLTCGSSTDLPQPAKSFDLIITDPPFGDNVQYAELADFFYVWLQKVLKDRYPGYFSSLYTPKALEAVTNRARHPEEPDDFYKRLLTQVWSESHRLLKDGGILAFTFHHSEDEPWIAVLESLFEAGFYLEATYPIRSDESKGEKAEFGSKKIEYDIIHVCRKRVEAPTSISWARLRKRMTRDIRQLEDILQNHLASGLTESDVQVIRRGKALEYFSRHYGKVYIEEGRPFTLREALMGINQILEDERDQNTESPPADAEVMTRQFLRIFNKTVSVKRNEMQNYLRGTGIAPSDFEEKNWCYEQTRTFFMVAPLEFAMQWKGKVRRGLSYDLDQTLFFIGASYENSGINIHETLSNPNFSLHPAVVPLLSWFTRNGGSSEIKQAALRALQLCTAWQSRNPDKVTEQLALFGMDEEE